MLTQPNLIPMPFANSGDANTIPTTNTTPSTTQAASWTSGFPVINSTPLAAGGIPPAREDFNGAFKALSEHTVWGQSGNLYAWDATLDYALHAHTRGSDGNEYEAITASGPNTAAGAKNPVSDDGTYWFNLSDFYARQGFLLCEFYYFRHPTLRPGFVQAAGGVISNADTLYPKAWAYLQTAAGQLLCKTEADWQAMSTAIYYTNANGQSEGWNGVGGVPYFVIDTANRTIRVPDIRGMYAEASGLDSLTIGGVHEDAIRDVTGSFVIEASPGLFCKVSEAGGAFVSTNEQNVAEGTQVSSIRNDVTVYMDLYRQVPKSYHNKPRAWGALACVYLGS